MFIILLVLTAVSAVAMVAGFGWLLASSGHTTRRSGPEVGAELAADMAEMQEQDAGAGATIAERSTFRGTGVKVEREADVSFADIKAALRRGSGREALPAQLAMGGLSGLLAFGSLALLAGWQEKLIGAIIAIAVLYCLVRIWIGFARA